MEEFNIHVTLIIPTSKEKKINSFVIVSGRIIEHLSWPVRVGCQQFLKINILFYWVSFQRMTMMILVKVLHLVLPQISRLQQKS